MQKSIVLVLLMAGFALGYFGIKDLNEKTAEFNIGEVKVTARSSESATKGYVLLGAGALCVVLGVVLLVKSRKQ